MNCWRQKNFMCISLKLNCQTKTHKCRKFIVKKITQLDQINVNITFKQSRDIILVFRHFPDRSNLYTEKNTNTKKNYD